MAGLHPETALSDATRKFIGRFQKMEGLAAEKDTRLEDLPREEMENLWRMVKKGGSPTAGHTPAHKKASET